MLLSRISSIKLKRTTIASRSSSTNSTSCSISDHSESHHFLILFRPTTKSLSPQGCTSWAAIQLVKNSFLAGMPHERRVFLPLTIMAEGEEISATSFFKINVRKSFFAAIPLGAGQANAAVCGKCGNTGHSLMPFQIAWPITFSIALGISPRLWSANNLSQTLPFRGLYISDVNCSGPEISASSNAISESRASRSVGVISFGARARSRSGLTQFPE